MRDNSRDNLCIISDDFMQVPSLEWNRAHTLLLPLLFIDEYVQIVTDFGGKVEALRLMSRSTGALRDVLLTDNANETAITENKFWKGMLLVPWANRIAYVS